MNKAANLRRTIDKLAEKRGVFRADAYLFALEAIEQAMQSQSTPAHISGEYLLDWIVLLGKERYGPMAPDVFRSWGVHNTLDFGRIVFHLVEARLLRKREEDNLTDFLDKFDFEEAFSLKVFKGQA
ncbi:MAG: hypothetical protein GY780_15085 [bacterium]|nr:hypothetical protein [bacterium]